MRRIICLFFALLLFSGCTGDFIGTNVEDLLVAPQPNALQGAVFDAIKGFAGDQAVIVSPTEGAHTGALVIDDGGFSGKEAVITFYSTSNSGTDINLALLHKNEQELTVLHAITGLGNDVESVEYAYLDQSGVPYLMVSYSGVTANERYLAIYRFNSLNMEIESVFAQDYRAMLLADIAGGDEEEIIFALPSTRDGAMNMRIISLAEGEPSQLYLGAPNPAILEAKQLYYSTSGENRYIVVDGIDSENNSTSDLIEFVDGEVVSLLEQQGILTHNVPLLQSADIDSDGVIEQPTVLTQPEGMDGTGYIMVGYYDIQQNQQSPKYIAIVNTRLAFMVLIPPHWYNDVTCENRDDSFTLYSADGTRELFAIDVTEDAEIISHTDGVTQQVMLLGSFRVYLTTFNNLTEYELSYLKDGIQQMY